jgi:hypothetical protein
MAITKAILAEKILRKIFGGDYVTSANVKKQDVYLELESARNFLIQKFLNSSSNDISSQFETTYPAVAVLKDSVRDRFYSVLPAQLISLVIKGNSSNGIGIRQVSGSKDEYDVFIPMNSNDTGVFHGLEASSMGGKIGYWLEGEKLLYENMPYYWENKTVLIKMISSIYSLDENAFIPVPAGSELELEDLVYQRMMAMRGTPIEKLADNNPNTKA